MLLVIISIISLPKKEETKETRGVFISYIEISEYLQDKDEKDSKEQIIKMIQNCENFGLNTIILQVRPSMDSIYESKIFPISKYLSSTGSYSYDVLHYFLEECHKRNIKLIAWINPYRVSTTGTIKEIKENSPVFEYIGSDILYENNGVFLNPARKESINLIKKGVEELVKYPIDGLLMDDYFYPGEEVDDLEYKKVSKSIPKEEFRYQVINEMVKEVHKICKDNNLPFGISPEGNLENNYHKNYADIKTWFKEEYVDFIMPQLYYGFENTGQPFVETSNYWQNMNQKNIPLYVALSLYKVGKEDSYAREGKNEWLENSNIIQREIIHSRSLKNYKGFILYRYDNLFTETSQKEIKNILEVIK